MRVWGWGLRLRALGFWRKLRGRGACMRRTPFAFSREGRRRRRKIGAAGEEKVEEEKKKRRSSSRRA